MQQENYLVSDSEWRLWITFSVMADPVVLLITSCCPVTNIALPEVRRPSPASDPLPTMRPSWVLADDSLDDSWAVFVEAMAETVVDADMVAAAADCFEEAMVADMEDCCWILSTDVALFSPWLTETWDRSAATDDTFCEAEVIEWSCFTKEDLASWRCSTAILEDEEIEADTCPWSWTVKLARLDSSTCLGSTTVLEEALPDLPNDFFWVWVEDPVADIDFAVIVVSSTADERDKDSLMTEVDVVEVVCCPVDVATKEALEAEAEAEADSAKYDNFLVSPAAPAAWSTTSVPVVDAVRGRCLHLWWLKYE